MKLDDYKNYPKLSDGEIEPNLDPAACGWYDGPLCGPCQYEGETLYYHMCDAAARPRWHRRYLVFRMTPEQGNTIEKGEDLDAYEAIGWFEI